MESGHNQTPGRSGTTSSSRDGENSAETNGAVLVISCDSCIMRNTEACNDCMMSVLCDPPSDGAVVLNLEELREIRLLAKAGLVPTLRHRAVG